MTETRETTDPLSGQTVSIRNDLIERLRGRYAIGPTLPNGEPEFGWREMPTVPIQLEAASEIEADRARIEHLEWCAGASDIELEEERADNTRLRALLAEAGEYVDVYANALPKGRIFERAKILRAKIAAELSPQTDEELERNT